MEYQKSAGFVVYYIENNNFLSPKIQENKQEFCDKNKEIKFLLLKYPHYWGFPKGLIESSEQIKETAIRELEEETGIKEIEIIPGFECKQEWFFKLAGKIIKKEAIFLLAKTNKEEAGKVKVSFEHEAFIWLDFDKALKKLAIKNNKEMLEKANEFILEHETSKSKDFDSAQKSGISDK